MFKTISEDHEDGFSLVEILVGVVIIGIIAGIAIGVGLNQREKAFVAKADIATKAISKEASDTKIRTLSKTGYKNQFVAPTVQALQKNYDSDVFHIAKYAYTDGKRVTYVENKKYDSICYLLYRTKEPYNDKFRQINIISSTYPEGKVTHGASIGCPSTYTY